MRFKSVCMAAATALAMAALDSPAAFADVPCQRPIAASRPATTVCNLTFTVYSLNLLNLQATGNTIHPGDPFDVSTNGIALQNSLVVATGVGGAGAINSIRSAVATRMTPTPRPMPRAVATRIS